MSQKKIIGLIVVVLIVIGLFFWLRHHSPAPTIPAPVTTVDNSPVKTVIGHSVQGRDIEAYTYGKGSTRMLFVGGIHGGYEWNSVLLAYKFMDYIRDNPGFIPANLSVTVIPDANPDAVFTVTGKEGRFAESDVSTDEAKLTAARFNANKVDLNRNFDCKWQPKSTWQSRTVSAGSKAFSEPEAEAIRAYVQTVKPFATIFWHSQSNAVYASQCQDGILPATMTLMNTYADASGYPAVKTFDAYATTGAADDWMASVGLPAVTVELSTHSSIEWERNLKGIRAVIDYFGVKSE